MTDIDLEKLAFDSAGLIPAVIQDRSTRKVLMLAYMNRESLRRTMETGETYFWSRSRKSLWHKGETSGNTQKVYSIASDCDGDSLVVVVEQKGNACHTGSFSCFSNMLQGDPSPGPEDIGHVLTGLEKVIRERKDTLPEGSYTSYLFTSGLDKILKKVGEEAAETIIAAKNHKKDEIILEVSDLLYHVLVLLAEENVGLQEVALALAERKGKKSGKGQ